MGEKKTVRTIELTWEHTERLEVDVTGRYDPSGQEKAPYEAPTEATGVNDKEDK